MKRFLFLLLAVSICSCLLIFPVYAVAEFRTVVSCDEYGNFYSFTSDTSYFTSGGPYAVELNLLGYDESVLLPCVTFMYDSVDDFYYGSSTAEMIIDGVPFLVDFNILFTDSVFVIYPRVHATDDRFSFSGEMQVEVVISSVPDAVDVVNACFDDVLGWFGQIIRALISGSLSGLLPVFVVAIAVAAVFLGIRVFRHFSWGF